MSGSRLVRITSRSFGEASPEALGILRDAGHTVVDTPRGPFHGDRLIAELTRAHAAIVGTDGLDAAVLGELPELRVLVKHGIGVDNIDLDAARRAGVTVANVKGSNANAVAEYVVAAMLAVVRFLVPARASLARGEWRRFIGRELGGLTIGLLGFGRTGRAVAARLAGFRPRMLAHDPLLTPDEAARTGVLPATFEEVLSQSDVLSLHLPLAPATRNLVDATALGRMKTGAVLINAARGGLVDARALAAALDRGHLAGAAVDVFDHEPPPADHPLLGREDVLCTPHIAAYTADALGATSLIAARHVVDLLAGDACDDALTRPFGARP
jgi:phosphoglycerate dehydrogenase-like enzyme